MFDNAYGPKPICASPRFAMMVGQASSRIGAFDNAAELPPSVATFAHYLRGEPLQSGNQRRAEVAGSDREIASCLHIPHGGTPDEFTRFLADEGARWSKLAKDANSKLE